MFGSMRYISLLLLSVVAENKISLSLQRQTVKLARENDKNLHFKKRMDSVSHQFISQILKNFGNLKLTHEIQSKLCFSNNNFFLFLKEMVSTG